MRRPIRANGFVARAVALVAAVVLLGLPVAGGLPVGAEDRGFPNASLAHAAKVREQYGQGLFVVKG